MHMHAILVFVNTRGSRAAGQRGFTLIELIIVIVLMGVLAVVAAPRMINTGDFYARGFHDQTLAYLRYAQKTAIAQRRTVCVSFSNSPTAVSLTLAATAATNTCTLALSGPSGASGAAREADLVSKSGVTFSGTPTSFNFDGLGQPVSTTTGAVVAPPLIQVVGASKSITVEAVTGFVHE